MSGGTWRARSIKATPAAMISTSAEMASTPSSHSQCAPEWRNERWRGRSARCGTP